MREIFLFLVLTNLGFLAWSQWIVPPGLPAAQIAGNSTVPRLKLVREVRGESQVAASEDEVPAEPLRCVSLGPFLDLPEAAEAAAGLREQGFQPSQRIAESEVWVGHWVYLPPVPSREAANAVVAQLRTQGVTDLYVEPAGELENAISLGLYSDRVRAETRAGSMRRFGHSPEIRDRHRLASVYWVDIVLRNGHTVAPGDYPTRPGRIVRLEDRDCKEYEVAGSPVVRAERGAAMPEAAAADAPGVALQAL